jgi:hypothetical protein
MLTEIDRLQLAARDGEAVARIWTELLGARAAGEDRVASLGARRQLLRLGRGFIEILVPDGPGPVAAALERRGPHLFAAGAATREPGPLLAHLRAKGIEPPVEHGQIHLDERATGIPGFRLVVSPHEALPPVGDIDFLYEATLVTDDWKGATERAIRLFALDPASHVPIASEKFGYEGVLTLFTAGRLHRFEIIAPTRPGTTMARHLERFGPALYMGFAETPAMSLIEERLRRRGLGATIDRPAGRAVSLPADQLWIHPASLCGTMLGLSRPSMAWSWSGSPERVERVG